jgi:gamma-glutamylaminecyclotransferase
MKYRIFVYGTLKRGLKNAHYLAGQTFLAEARTKAEYRMVSLGGYPGMIEASDKSRCISGEVWEVDQSCKRGLDELEGLEEGFYVFAPVRLLAPFDDGSVFTYLYARSVSGCPDAGDNWSDDA